MDSQISHEVENYPLFSKLEQTALSYLENALLIPGCAVSQNHWLQLRIWHFPSFDVSRSWSIYSKGKSNELCVRQVTWDRPNDLQRLTHPLESLRLGIHTNPKIEVRDRNLQIEVFDHIVGVAEKIAIPLFISSQSVVCDGEILGLEQPERLTIQCNSGDGISRFSALITDAISRLEAICGET